MERNLKLIVILAAIAAGFIIPTCIIVQEQNGQYLPNVDGGPVVVETSGPYETWEAVKDPVNSLNKDAGIETSNGRLVMYFQFVPDDGLPVSVGANARVVVYKTTIPPYSNPFYYYGYKVSGGWWLMFFPMKDKDQVIIDYMLVLAEA